jgi:isoleucyl-tRNA synthetase
VTGAIEIARAEKRIGSSLQAHPVMHIDSKYRDALDGVDFAEVTITSALTVTEAAAPADAFAMPEVEGVRVVVGLASGTKCERCWKVLDEVGSVPGHGTVCKRCADAVDYFRAAAE